MINTVKVRRADIYNIWFVGVKIPDHGIIIQHTPGAEMIGEGWIIYIAHFAMLKYKRFRKSIIGALKQKGFPVIFIISSQEIFFFRVKYILPKADIHVYNKAVRAEL